MGIVNMGGEEVAKFIKVIKNIFRVCKESSPA